jgi:hypothetical protein
MGACDRAGDVLRARGHVDPDGVVAPEALEPAGEERLEREVAAVLLAHDDDDRGAVHPGRGQRRDRVAESRGRVQERERRGPRADRQAAGHPDRRALVQARHGTVAANRRGPGGRRL